MKNVTKKRLCLSVLLLLWALLLPAQESLDLRSRALLRRARMEHRLTADTLSRRHLPAAAGQKAYVTGLVKLADGATAEQLEAAGAHVLACRENIAMALFPIDEVERIACERCVHKLELSRDLSPKCDLARLATGVDLIHAGEGLPQAYTGEGVVTGLFDAGLDPNHVNFRNEDGTSRISYLMHIYASKAATEGFVVKEYGKYSEAPVSKFKTDDSTSYHGTHTLGIMAGGWRGDITVAQKEDAFRVTVSETANPFYGMAPNSDIAATCGTLQDMFIAYGCEGILNYAAAMRKPAVINLSLGSNIGTHDGKSVLSQYFDLVGKEAIICVASGNEGELPIALHKTLQEGDTIVRTFIAPMSDTYGNYKNLRYGTVEIYSNDSTEFTLKAVVYNKKRGAISFMNVCDHNTENVATYYASPGYGEDGDLSHTNFTNAFNGYVGVGSCIEPESGRYWATVDYFTSDNTSTNAVGNYILGFVVEGHPGQRIDCFCDGAFTVLDGYNQTGWSNGSADGSISDMACAENILVVGSYNTRDDWGSLDGYVHGYQGLLTAGAMSAFTSYGTLIDGRQLPHVCAPGAAIISSSNSYALGAYTQIVSDEDLQGKLQESGRYNYWHQSLGTSMATPVVAGAIALWLEANPKLTIDDVKDIIAQTAVVDDDVRTTGTPVQWGAGKFDAYAGLKEAIRRATGVDNVSESARRLMVVPVGEDAFNVFLGGVSQMEVVLWSAIGQQAGRFVAAGDELTLNVGGLPAGMYILQVNSNHTERIIVK